MLRAVADRICTEMRQILLIIILLIILILLLIIITWICITPFFRESSKNHSPAQLVMTVDGRPSGAVKMSAVH